MNSTPSLRPQRTWQGQHRGISFKIVSWGKSRDETYGFPSGNWNYYVYIPESKSPRFEEIWLADEEKQWGGSGTKYISHDYYASILGSVEMHGGITFYSKHGHTPGHRCVEIGCDYQHLWDEGKYYDENDLLADAMTTIDDLFNRGILVEGNNK